MDFSEILEDIQQTTSEEINFPPPPYMEEEDFQVKFSATLRSVTKSIRLKDTQLAMINSFYLGQLLDQLPTPSERLKYKHKMSLHYATIVEKTFDIFEFFPEQILRTKKLDVQVIRKITRPQIRKLRNNLLIFAGAAN
ncbi:hypothetical protein GLOIN_2v1884596 [Rhizophagus irregularis DAOM 181602=DAOM 197198]|uniref:Uncharacterized protein n=2 Tax=Rhizophagus irregularis TaxID=588596 RepID=A0A015J767_RHIIW|nr:hypothetical protein GLOIN_2v1884596 [Rhizophagus irregularis DAOM 181602=DAOM 197198]EXX65407.1 hypothetical protein RirG_133590 [Rhizophagus irregularis DAOM 197198w]POG60022.1 hypothetical protein GLOIN_2v1884596 [Rhizophagus irregularis DAOM 181602=DAOM 197198]GBC18990.1 hypothetical protein GLOIN_2v1884596 [Rhizophagus irregularis DAOM 181602=DAOM 197198]GET58869.1 hypothetical protein GLOIN_2v1884596 [Rhizophagus irregularis DAOM 181602=DAOM 197198]GET63244.1 hypothetical protein GLOI|eukprot:XP_025166888.1 hypothetical protein GLOIN_2v1884596 [Rhizophagus irregularis DAOM 181602=DAOM 197198]